MKQNISSKKLAGTFVFAILAILFAITLVSADSLSISSPSLLTSGQNSTFTITIPGASGSWNLITPVFPSNLQFDDGNGNIATVKLTTTDAVTNLNGLSQVNVKASVTSVDSGFSLTSVPKSVTFTAQNVSNPSQTISSDVTLNFAQTYCENGAIGSNLEITSMTDENLDNEKDWEWGPTDNIEVTVRVRNHDSNDDIDAIVAYGIYDQNNDDFVLEDQESVTVSSGDYEDVTLKFKMPTKDLTENSYRFYVKAYDDNDGEDVQCTDTNNGAAYRSISIKRQTNEVQIQNVDAPTSVQCGDQVDIKMSVVDIGKKDESKVKVTLTNTDLGLKQDFIVNDLNKGDSKSVDFNFLVPKTLKEGTYNLKTQVSYDYDDNDNSYSLSKSVADIPLQLSGNCVLTANDVQLLVDQANAIQSGGKAGEPLVIKASVVNSGTRTATFDIKASGYDSWATLTNVEPQSFNLDSLSTRDVLLYFDVNKQATGDNSFKISLESNGQTLKEQTVTVPIQKSSAFSISGNSIINSDNWYLWGLGVLNVILVILIIVIAVKVSRRK